MATSVGKAACLAGIALIEEQLAALRVYAAALTYWSETNETVPDVMGAAGIMKRKRIPVETQLHTAGNPATNGDETPEIPADLLPLGEDPARLASLVRVAGSNALLAVADFFQAHDLSTLRTPEVQFLMDLRNAIANGNRFAIGHGQYLLAASFEGLVIDETLDGTLVFGDGKQDGFVELGDVVVLLEVLMYHLRGMQRPSPGGDAG
jgi:hypothetical protein